MNPYKTTKTALFSWCLFDWAIAGFPVIITTFIFSTYFTSHIAENEITGTYQWANAIALAGFIVAMASPIFGAIADHSGGQKRWLGFCTGICILSSALLWFAYPSVHYVYYTLIFVILGTIGFELGGVFYNAFLPHIAPRRYMGRVSGWGWSIGYLGGIAILTIALFGFVQSPPPWLDTVTAAPARICGPLVAVWLLLFSLPFFLNVPEMTSPQLPMKKAIKRGLSELIHTLKTLPQQKNLFLYLVAHLIYIDGLNTLFAFGGIYAAGTFKMDLSEVILFGIAMNLTAGIGAFFLAWVDDLLGSKPTILISLTFLTIFGIAVLLIESKFHFWIFGLSLSFFVGSVQAASRSLMARLSPEEKSAGMFGLYSFSGRATAFVGPWLLGVVTLHFHTQRAGMATVILFFIVGGILMCFVREPRNISRYTNQTF